jgi:hypothetical protein
MQDNLYTTDMFVLFDNEGQNTRCENFSLFSTTHSPLSPALAARESTICRNTFSQFGLKAKWLSERGRFDRITPRLDNRAQWFTSSGPVGGYSGPNLTVRVFDDRRPLIFCLPFLPARA